MKPEKTFQQSIQEMVDAYIHKNPSMASHRKNLLDLFIAMYTRLAEFQRHEATRSLQYVNRLTLAIAHSKCKKCQASLQDVVDKVVAGL